MKIEENSNQLFKEWVSQVPAERDPATGEDIMKAIREVEYPPPEAQECMFVSKDLYSKYIRMAVKNE